jgi:hypothetical protein
MSDKSEEDFKINQLIEVLKKQTKNETIDGLLDMSEKQYNITIPRIQETSKEDAKVLGKYDAQQILEENDFNIGEITEQDGSYYIELSQYTPLGEDWYVAVRFDGNDEDFIDQFDRIYQNFDVDEEFEVFIDMRGKNGVPTSSRELFEDQEWKLKTLRTTLRELKGEDEDEEYTITLKLTDNGKTVWASSNEDPIGEESTFKTITDRGEQMLIALATYLGYEPSMVLNLEGILEEEEATKDTEPWKVFYYGLKELGAYTVFGEGGGEEQATKELLASELKVKPSDIEVKIEMR